jgi:hypothetical protein
MTLGDGSLQNRQRKAAPFGIPEAHDEKADTELLKMCSYRRGGEAGLGLA